MHDTYMIICPPDQAPRVSFAHPDLSMMNRGILFKITSKAQAAACIDNTTSAGGELASTEQLHPASSTAMRPARAANCLLTATATTTKIGKRASSTNKPTTANHQSEERPLYETNPPLGLLSPRRLSRASVGLTPPTVGLPPL